ncbi:hypothetical protein DACRYDRAFT_36409, partial [Dacryopinax primogenitus]
CPACPLPGVNMTREHTDTPSNPLCRHLATLIVGGDGNSHLQLKDKWRKDEDISILDGQGYFLLKGKFEEYV